MNQPETSCRPADPVRRFEDLDSKECSEIVKRVLKFQLAIAVSEAKVEFSPFLEGLPADLRRIALREMMVEDWQWRHQQLNDSLYCTYREQIDSTLADTLLAESMRDESSTHGNSSWPRINGFELRGELGKGGTAIVYRAIQHRFNREIAIKVPIRQEGNSDLTLQRFQVEAALQAKYLEAGVPAVFSFGLADGGLPYIAMELVNGDPLQKFFPESRALFESSRNGVKLIGAVSRALAPIHRDGTSHLDLSAGNVFITHEGKVKILDFGFGQTKSQSEPGGALGGTLDYMAPEKARGETAAFSPRTDVFSLGAFLARMITGEPLFTTRMGDNEKLKRIRVADYREAEARIRKSESDLGVPAELVNLTLECLSEDPSNRPRDAGAVALRIEEYFHSEEVELHRFQIETAKRQAEEAARAADEIANRRRRQIVRNAFVAVFGVLLVGSVVSIAFALRANAEKQRASRNAALRLATLEDVIQVIAGDSFRRAGQIEMQRGLLERLLPRINDVLSLEDQDDSTREQQGLAWNALTVIRQAMHEDDDSLKAATRAEAIFRAVGKSASSSPSIRLALATALSNQALILGQRGNMDEAIQKCDEASQLLTKLIDDNGKDAHLRFRLTLTENCWANCLMRKGNTSDAKEHYLSAVRHIEIAEKLSPKEVAYRAWHAKALSNLAVLTRMQASESEGSKTLAEVKKFTDDSVDVARSLVSEFPNEIDARESLAVCVTNAATLMLSDGDAAASYPLFKESLTLYTRLATQVPAYKEFAWGRAMAESNVGAALASGSIDDGDEAEMHLQQADVLYRELDDPNNKELQLYIEENRGRMEELRQKRTPLTN